MPDLGKQLSPALCLAAVFVGADAHASELSYTFLDFQYLDQTVESSGTQLQPGNQSVTVRSRTGDGVGIAGSLGLGDRFFLAGRFTSSIVGVTGTVTNPMAQVTVNDTYDLITSEFSFGYVRPVARDLDLVFELTYDSSEYDFGTFAGENFDVEDSGVGARAGFRWNPNRGAIELYAYAHYSPVGEVSLDRLAFESDLLPRAGFMWYVFEDLGMGIDFRSGQVESRSISMRFSFGTLQW